MLKKLFKKIPYPPEFDITVYLRYQPILAKISQLNKPKIAEVGSGSYGIGPYLKKSFSGFDINFSKKKSPFLKPVIASAIKIPKKFYQKFDLVLSVDMMEHLSPKDRSRSLANLVSLTKKHLLVAFPTGQGASLVDRILDWYYQKTHQKRLGFLLEHRRYPLPKTGEIKDQLITIINNNNRQITSLKIINNTNLLVYLVLLLLGFSEKRYLTRIYSLTFFIRKILSKINLFPYRKMIILELT